jgi:hypothetical protein
MHDSLSGDWTTFADLEDLVALLSRYVNGRPMQAGIKVTLHQYTSR